MNRLDHIAIGVSDLDYIIDQLVGTGGMKLIRRGVLRNTGTRIAMVGDKIGTKLELIESADATGGAPKFLHLAFSSDDVEETSKSLADKGWKWERGPFDIEPAHARSVSHNLGHERQIGDASNVSGVPPIATDRRAAIRAAVRSNGPAARAATKITGSWPPGQMQPVAISNRRLVAADKRKEPIVPLEGLSHRRSRPLENHGDRAA